MLVIRDLLNEVIDDQVKCLAEETERTSDRSDRDEALYKAGENIENITALKRTFQVLNELTYQAFTTELYTKKEVLKGELSIKTQMRVTENYLQRHLGLVYELLDDAIADESSNMIMGYTQEIKQLKDMLDLLNTLAKRDEDTEV